LTSVGHLRSSWAVLSDTIASVLLLLQPIGMVRASEQSHTMVLFKPGVLSILSNFSGPKLSTRKEDACPSRNWA
jgi:hypothetical protein